MNPMLIHATNDFAADVPTVFAMLLDPVFLRAACLAAEPLDHSVQVDGLHTASTRVMPTPSVAARFTGPTMSVTDEIVWVPGDGPTRSGTARISVDGLPAELLGSVNLAPGGRGSVLTYEGNLEVKVPVLGPSLAKQAAPVLLEALALQQQVGDQYLARS
jgi:Protein of unknown function (DUF2505).